MFITVAICTRNRAESLRRTLNSLAAMSVPGDLEWELVIVNNNSTDHTDTVIDVYRDRLPVRREFEPVPGLSNARNRAIDGAEGKYIVWTDDDVVVDSGWLTAYFAGFLGWPEAAVFGGRITPIYEEPVAQWVKESEALLRGPYGVRDFGKDVLPLSVTEDRLPFGANFAVRSLEQQVFRYDPDLGIGPKTRRLGEETDVVTRLLESGATGYWLPAAKLEHFITKKMQTTRHIANFAAALGETDARQGVPWSEAPRKVWPLKRWLRYRYHRLMSPAPVWVGDLQAYAYAKGTFRYYWQQQRLRSEARDGRCS
jgi:glucosyl-dolichyl phosphate glucuronosyltransferase